MTSYSLLSTLIPVALLALGSCAGSRPLACKPGEPLAAGKIPDVGDWTLTKEGLLYASWEKDRLTFAPIDHRPSQLYDLDYDPWWLHPIGDGFVNVDGSNKPRSIFVQRELRLLDKQHLPNIVIQQQDSRYLAVHKSDHLPSTYNVFDWKENKHLMQESKRPYEVVKDKALTIIENVLYGYDLTGKLLWQYEPAPGDADLNGESVHVTQRGSYPRMLGIYHNELWIQPDTYRLIALNATTGKPIFTNYNLKAELGLTDLSTGDAFLDEQSGKIRILAYAHYLEIDLATHQAAIKKTFDGDWSIGNGTFYPGDPRIYFVGNETAFPARKSIGNITVGIFNTETLQIEWHYSLPDEDEYYFFVKLPQANEKYFGIRDSNHVLFLFER